MPQHPRPLTPDKDVQSFFGAQVRYWRERRRLSQAELGALVWLSGDMIAKLEKGERWPPDGFAERCDEALAIDGILTRLIPWIQLQRSISDSADFQDLLETQAARASLEDRERRIETVLHRVDELTRMVEALILALTIKTGTTHRGTGAANATKRRPRSLAQNT